MGVMPRVMCEDLRATESKEMQQIIVAAVHQTVKGVRSRTVQKNQHMIQCIPENCSDFTMALVQEN